MSKQPAYVIIGNGITGVTAAEILRKEDPLCTITIIANDPFPVYYRPALKDYLGGRLSEEKLWARPTIFYRDLRIRFVPGHVVAINTTQQFVQMHNGQRLSYDKLLLASGAHPRTLSCPGLDLAGVSTLRTIADYQEILRRLENTQRVVVYGSGTLALETAETLNHRGYAVVHLMRGTILWLEVLDPVASDLVLHEERRAGIDVRTGEEIAAITGKNGQVAAAVTIRGERIDCDLVLIAIGIEPNTSAIRTSGIACGRGVKVDNGMCTSATNVYAAGDVIEITDESTGRARVLGQWFPAIQQAQVAAYNMLGMLAPDHPFYPGSSPPTAILLQNYYNATFLHGLDFVSIGQPSPPPSAQRYQTMFAPPLPQTYRKIILHEGRMLGALLLGNRTNALAYKRAIDYRVNLSPIISQLFAPDFALDDWLNKQGVPPLLLNVHKEGVPELHTVRESGNMDTNTAVRLPALSASNSTVQDNDAFLVPIPHPSVQLAITEMQLNKDAKASEITIGREPGVSLLLDHRSVSRLHAEIVCSNSAYILRDCGSSNGTFVDGKAVTHSISHVLCHHDRIRFGDVQFRFELRPRAARTEQTASALLRSRFPHMQQSELHASVSRIIPESILHSLNDTPTLVLMGKDTSPSVIELEDGKRYSVGRGRENEIVLDDAAASRQHAEIFSAPDGFYIRDINSRYGVFVNAVRINNAFHLSHGDSVVLGNTLAYFSYTQGHTSGQTMLVPVAMGQNSPSITMKNAAIRTPLSSNNDANAPVVAGLSHRSAIRALDMESIQFEINMCIGCDRCMDACPIPMSSRVTIADLNHATISQSVTPRVMQFTHECIMCGSCVPVCPVDNHRDLLMLSLKQRVGVSWDIAPTVDHLATSLPSGWTIPLLISRLREQAILNNPQYVPDTYLLHIVAASTTRVLMAGEALIREGEYGRNIYLILDGYLQLTTTVKDNREFPVAILRHGECVGADGMLTGRPYTSSAYAQKPMLVLEVPEQVMQRLMELVPQVRSHFERSYAVFSLQAILKRIALFQGVADADMQRLVQQTPIRSYERGEQLFAGDGRKGRPSRETLHVLLEGFVKVARHTSIEKARDGSEERILAYRQQGDYFAGGLDLLGDGQAVTVTAINRCRVAEVPRSTLLALFQHYPEVQQRFALRLREYVETAASVQGYSVVSGPLRNYNSATSAADVSARAGLQSLVHDGVMEGTEVLVIDLDKCIHCDECENACARRHGHSRMNRKGMVIGNISVATACRQCHDPMCMLCSRAGIARHPNGEVYITESCIGCGICAERCPYGAISITDVVGEEEVAQSTWVRFGEFFKGVGKERARRTIPVLNAVRPESYATPGPLTIFQPGGYDEIRKKVAIKCDLCAGFSDQACVQACPTGAAIRIQPATFFGSTEEILRRRAN